MILSRDCRKICLDDELGLSLKIVVFINAFLEKEMATHSNILAWRIPETEEPSGLPSMGSAESDMTEVT